jgi:hypothetical protein
MPVKKAFNRYLELLTLQADNGDSLAYARILWHFYLIVSSYLEVRWRLGP